MLKNIKNFSVSTPLPPALKSTQQYLETILKVNPDWSERLNKCFINSKRILSCLWAGAVAVANACRISEVLRIEGKDILPNGTAIITASKNSNARMIYLGLDRDLVCHLKNNFTNRSVFGVQYREVWGALVRFGLAVQEIGHKNNAVTHAGRYAVAKEVAKNHGEEVAGQVLGHRSKNAITYYLHPELQPKRSLMRKRMDEGWNRKLFGPKLPGFLMEEEN